MLSRQRKDLTTKIKENLKNLQKIVLNTLNWQPRKDIRVTIGNLEFRDMGGTSIKFISFSFSTSLAKDTDSNWNAIPNWRYP